MRLWVKILSWFKPTPPVIDTMERHRELSRHLAKQLRLAGVDMADFERRQIKRQRARKRAV